jgi:hypothetical protein
MFSDNLSFQSHGDFFKKYHLYILAIGWERLYYSFIVRDNFELETIDFLFRKLCDMIGCKTKIGDAGLGSIVFLRENTLKNGSSMQYIQFITSQLYHECT